MEITDIHTHRPAPYPQGVIALDAVELASKYASADAVELCEGQLYSLGIHPWKTENDVPAAALDMLRALAVNPQIVAIGESGVDSVKGGPMFRQLLIFQECVKLSEQLRKPLIIHDVKAHDMILGVRSDLKPAMPWAIHGFRGKPSVAEMFTSKDIYLSFGAKFNSDTVRMVPEELLLAETDDSETNIDDVVAAVSAIRGQDMSAQIKENVSHFLSHI